MKLICPACGAVASAESWENDLAAREAIMVVSKLAVPVNKHALGYVSLFRPDQRSSSWKKTLRILQEIEQLVATGYVHIQGKVDRDCPPRIWAAAMEQMIEQRHSLRLPMASHIYLTKIAWDMADQADRRAEQKQTTTHTESRPVADGGADPRRDPLEKARREYDEKVARGEVAAINVAAIIKGMG